MRSVTLWKTTTFILASLIVISQFLPSFVASHRQVSGPLANGIEGNRRNASFKLVKTVLADEVYPEFTCPCCGQPLNKEEPCCNSMIEMIEFIDQQIAVGMSKEEVMLATVRKFGIDRLTRDEKRNEIKALLAASAPADAAKISFSQDFHNLGKVSQKQGTVSTDFKLQNKGKSDLVIDKLSSSCGCTSASIIYKDKENPRFTMEGHGEKNPTDWHIEIAPGDTAILRVYYDPTVHKDLTGPVTRTVSVFSNDPVEFEKKVTITLDQIP